MVNNRASQVPNIFSGLNPTIDGSQRASKGLLKILASCSTRYAVAIALSAVGRQVLSGKPVQEQEEEQDIFESGLARHSQCATTTEGQNRAAWIALKGCVLAG